MVEAFSLNDILFYFWPLINVAQFIASVYAVRKVGGTGPTLMLVGSGILLLMMAYTRFLDPGSADYGTTAYTINFVAQQVVFITARVLFVLGLLLMIQRSKVAGGDEMISQHFGLK